MNKIKDNSELTLRNIEHFSRAFTDGTGHIDIGVGDIQSLAGNITTALNSGIEADHVLEALRRMVLHTPEIKSVLASTPDGSDSGIILLLKNDSTKHDTTPLTEDLIERIRGTFDDAPTFDNDNKRALVHTWLDAHPPSYISDFDKKETILDRSMARGALALATLFNRDNKHTVVNELQQYGL